MREFININKYNILLLISYISSLLLFVLKIESAFYLIITIQGFILGTYLFKNTKFNSFFYIGLVSFFLGYSLLIVIFSLLNILGLTLISFPLSIAINSFLILCILAFRRVNLEKGLVLNRFELIWIILLTLIGVLSRLGSIYLFEVPILHDPIANAFWAKKILETGLIEYFYSPGLQIFTAIGEYLGGWSIGKNILILTNLFQAISFIPIFLFIKEYFKNKDFALITASLFVAGFVPASFFWTAGKNALVIAIPLFFLLLFFCITEIEKRKKIFFINLIFFSLILTHYPVAFVGGIFAIFLLFSQYKFKSLYHLIVGGVLGLVWAFLKYPYEIERLDKNIDQIVYTPQISDVSLEEVGNFFEALYTQSYLQFQNNAFMHTVYYLGIIGLLIMIIKAFFNKKYKFIMLGFLINLLSMLLMHLNIIPKALRIIYSTQQLFFLFSMVYLGFGFLIGEVIIPYIKKFSLNSKFVLYIILLFFVGYNSYEIFKIYKNYQTNYNLVEASDVEAFEWMNENLDEESEILNNASNPERRESVIFAGDSGAWLEVYTNFNIAMPFSEFSDKETHEYFSHYLKLKEDPSLCDEMEYFIDEGITYYYFGSRNPFSEQIIIEESLIEQGLYKLVFEEGNSKLYQINGCNMNF